MRANEIVNEISFASAIPDIKWSQHIIDQSEHVGTVDRVAIYAYSDNNHIFLFPDPAHSISAYVAISRELINGRHLLNRVVNTSRPGLVSILLSFAISELGSLCISNDEPLTPQGLQWVKNIIANPQGFSVTDLNSNNISASALDSEWQNAMNSGESGPAGILISIANGIKTRIKEQAQCFQAKSLFQPAYIFMD